MPLLTLLVLVAVARWVFVRPRTATLPATTPHTHLPSQGLHEPAWQNNTQQSYRWTMGDSVLALPNPSGPSILQVALAGGYERTVTAHVWSESLPSSVALSVSPSFRTYHMLFPSTSSSTINIWLTSPTVRGPDGENLLGVAVGSIQVMGGNTLPTDVLLTLVAAMVIAYSWLRWAGIPPGQTILLVAGAHTTMLLWQEGWGWQAHAYRVLVLLTTIVLVAGCLASLVFKRHQSFWVEHALLASVLLAVSGSLIASVPFHPDEAEWINVSGMFEAFIQGDFSGRVWHEGANFFVYHPPISTYAIAIGRRLAGYGPSSLNFMWVFERDFATNYAQGSLPGPELLWWSRLPMAVLFVVTLLVLSRLTQYAAGRGAGYLLLLLLAGNPYMHTTLLRAMSETALVTGVALTTLAGLQLVNSWHRTIPLLAWCVLMGVLAGLTGAAKLNGLSVVGVGILLCVLLPLADDGGSLPWKVRMMWAAGACMVMLVAMLVGFVAPNPHLYPNIPARTLEVFQERAMIMAEQYRLFPSQRIDTLAARLVTVPWQIFEHAATLRFPWAWVPNIGLCLVGLWHLVRQAWNRQQHSRTAGGASLVLVLAAVCTAGPPLLTPLNWDRYYILPVLFSTVCIAVGCYVLLSRASPTRSTSSSVL